MENIMSTKATSATPREQGAKSRLRRWIEILLGALGVVAMMAAGVTACTGEPVESEESVPGSEVEAELGEAASELTATSANLKVAFLADTSTGDNFKSVLSMIKNEGAQAVYVQGDMSYSGNADGWWDSVDSVLGKSFPVFITRGNHDDGAWSNYLDRANSHLGGATRVKGDHSAHYKTVFKGLTSVTINKGDGESRITNFLGNDTSTWKLCLWHYNQKAMQVGAKTDEMGWAVYERCRKLGAIIVTGHEHSYSRTKTLSSMTNQTVDASCSSRSNLCVGPNRTVTFVSGLGGNSVRDQERCFPTSYPHGCKGEWGYIYAEQQGATHGALFITFHVDGNPKKARGYFKDVAGNKKDSFTILRD
jgi:Calcineurin-like phosphoesterase